MDRRIAIGICIRASLRRIHAVVFTTIAFAGCTTVEFPRSSVETLDLSSAAYSVDSSYAHVTTGLASEVNTRMSGAGPAAWGRYLINEAGSRSDRNGFKELTVSELAHLRQLSIPLLPIVAPRQGDLRGSVEDGQQLARRAGSILDVFASASRSGQQILVFLDVEGDASPVSPEFLTGWCKGISSYHSVVGATLLPAVYTNAGLAASGVRRVITSVHENCQIKALWLAHYRTSPALPDAWEDMYVDSKRRLPVLPESIPILLWQYYAGENEPIDISMVNPAFRDSLVSQAMRLN